LEKIFPSIVASSLPRGRERRQPVGKAHTVEKTQGSKKPTVAMNVLQTATQQISTHADKTSGARRAAVYAAWGAGALALCKLILFFMTGSMVVALSAWDSTLDVFVSALNQKVIHFARQSPDSNHPYGHGLLAAAFSS